MFLEDLRFSFVIRKKEIVKEAIEVWLTWD